MIYTKQTIKAIKLMFEKHKDQVDKGGVPYVFHPWHVAEAMTDEKRTTVALLHDIIEDTDMTIEDLSKLDFDKEVLSALIVLTHNKSEDYFEYIKRVSNNSIATDVKIADLYHNLDQSRLERVDDKYLKKSQKYRDSLKFLLEVKKQNFHSDTRKI